MSLNVLLLAHSPSAAKDSPIVEERHELFVLAILSFLYQNSENDQKLGHDIAALIAWNVDDVEHTPEFVIDCNRRFEKQGTIFHAELQTIEQALLKKQRPLADAADPERSYREVSQRLAQATLYSSLEPCAFCTMGISWSRIPKVIYFMNDPWTRDSYTYEPLISFPQEFSAGRQLTQLSPSSLPLAIAENRALKELVLQNSSNQYVTIEADGRKIVDFRRYFEDRKKDLFKSGHEQFSSYLVRYDQNRELFKNLLETLTGGEAASEAVKRTQSIK